MCHYATATTARHGCDSPSCLCVIILLILKCSIFRALLIFLKHKKTNKIHFTFMIYFYL